MIQYLLMNYNFSFYTMARVLLDLFRYTFLNPVITFVHTDKGKYKQTKLVISKTSSHSKLKSSKITFCLRVIIGFSTQYQPLCHQKCWWCSISSSALVVSLEFYSISFWKRWSACAENASFILVGPDSFNMHSGFKDAKIRKNMHLRIDKIWYKSNFFLFWVKEYLVFVYYWAWMRCIEEKQQKFPKSTENVYFSILTGKWCYT